MRLVKDERRFTLATGGHVYLVLWGYIRSFLGDGKVRRSTSFRRGFSLSDFLLNSAMPFRRQMSLMSSIPKASEIGNVG